MDDHDAIKQFPKVFTGLGTFGEEYHIKQRENAVPYALYVSRNIPIPLRSKVKEELNRMEQMELSPRSRWQADGGSPQEI